MDYLDYFIYMNNIRLNYKNINELLCLAYYIDADMLICWLEHRPVASQVRGSRTSPHTYHPLP